MSVNNTMEIAVLGCGPAAVVSALGLAKLGYQVTVLGVVRKHPVIEGVSERVYQAIVQAGLAHAAQKVSEPVARAVVWNGEHNRANTERLIHRADFDQALIADLAAANIGFVNTRVERVEQLGDQWHIHTQKEGVAACYYAPFIVEARGRSAGFARDKPLRGPETVALSQQWQDSTQAAIAPFSCAVSVTKGWLWLASQGDGRLFSQLFMHASSDELPPKHALTELIREQLLAEPVTAAMIKNYQPVATAFGRSSTCILAPNPISLSDAGIIRVGDAAMAVDPLSGNGIFQSLSSALVVPSVVNTMLKRPAEAVLAAQFYRERINHLFYRFCRMGREFYQLESRWKEQRFWSERSQWPDLEASHLESDVFIGTEIKPVVNCGFIEAKPVVVTKNQPMGIWKIDGQPAVTRLAKGPANQAGRINNKAVGV